MNSERQEEKQDQKRHELLRLARNTFMHYGIRSVTLDEISAAAGMSKKTFYQLFDNKSALVKAVIEKEVAHEIEQIEEITRRPGNAVERLRAFFGCWMRIFQQMHPAVMHDLKKYHPEAWQLIEHYKWNELAAAIRQNLQQGIEEGLYRAEMNVDFLTNLHVARSDLVTDTRLFPPNQFSMPGIIREEYIYHLRGILSRKGLEYFESHQEELTLTY